MPVIHKVKRRFGPLLFLLASHCLTACSSNPDFQRASLTEGAASLVEPSDVVALIRCELQQEYSLNRQSAKVLDTYLVTAALSLRVDDNEGLNPSLSFIDPYRISGTSLAFGINGQLGGTRQRIFTENVAFKMTEIKSPACEPAPEKNGFRIGDKTLYGTLGIAQIIDMGLSVEKIPGVSFPAASAASAAPNHPTFGSTVQFTLTRGVGAGPTWTFAGFKGPSGTTGGGGNGSSAPQGLISYGRTDNHNFVISFASTEPKKLTAPFTASDAAAAAAANAASQALILDQRLQELQPQR
jgi:hypothetical protein